MARNVGLWIDYSECVISFPDEGEYIRRIQSHAGRRQEVAGGGEEAPRDPRALERLRRYYQEVISCVHSADAIVIFGAGDAKTELQEHLVAASLGDHVVSVADAPKMSTREVVAVIREAFAKQAVAAK